MAETRERGAKWSKSEVRKLISDDSSSCNNAQQTSYGSLSIKMTSYSSGSDHQEQRRTKSVSRIDIREGVTLFWDHLDCYAPEIGRGLFGRSVPVGTFKQLLFDVSGVAMPGALLAIMGASGAGKTTLLNVLTCRTTNLGNLRVQGKVKTNGVEMGANIKSVSAYVQQADVFWGRLKVREHLWFNAVLRMGSHFTAEEQNQRVDDILNEMGLDRCADSFINRGNVGEGTVGISGSERKLLSIASEIIMDPPLLFCDEPTTGLDSTMANTVVTMLQSMARRGKTILCTIHQPASNIFHKFDDLLLLAEGRLIFQGNKDQAAVLFEKAGMPCPMNYNPADHYIHMLAIRPGIEAECKAKVEQFAKEFRKSHEYANIKDKINTIDNIQGNPLFEDIMLETSNASPYRATWWTQVKANTWKQTIDQVRNPRIFLARIVQNLISALIICAVYFHQTYNQIGVTNISGAVYNLILQMTTIAIVQVGSFTSELQIFYREHHNGLYRTDAFYIAKNISEIPAFIIIILTSTVTTYWSIGLYPGLPQFISYIFVYAFVYHSALSVCVYTVGILTGRVDLALALANPVRIVMSLTGGFWANDGTIPPFIDWLKYLSWHRYSYKIIMVNQWSNVKHIECDWRDTSSCYQTGQDVIKFLNFDWGAVAYDYTCLAALVIIFRLLPVGLLFLKAREKKFRSK